MAAIVVERRVRQAGLAEGRDAQVGPADEGGDGAVDGGIDAGVRGEAREEDGDAERHAGDRQAGPQRARPEAAPGEAG